MFFVTDIINPVPIPGNKKNGICFDRIFFTKR